MTFRISSSLQKSAASELASKMGFDIYPNFLIANMDNFTAPSVDLCSISMAVADFFGGVRLYLNAALTEPKSQLARLLLPANSQFGIAFHADLISSNVPFTPEVFRTDEPTRGRICEVQCPGSMWGELFLLDQITNSQQLPAKTRKALLGNYSALKIHHLLDNASRPGTMGYAIRSLRKKGLIEYLGYDDNVRHGNCNYVVSHSFKGLYNHDMFKLCMKMAEDGVLRFAYPPTPLFEEKGVLCLPFEEESSHFFSDRVRHHFIFSSFITDDRIRIPDGSTLTFSDFSKLPQNKRRYYIKYAGGDSSRNWGSRGVYDASTFSQIALSRLFDLIKTDIENNEYWILQKSELGTAHGELLDGSSVKLHSKYSTFVVNGNPIGCLANFRRHRKVHGQPDTIYGIVR